MKKGDTVSLKFVSGFAMYAEGKVMNVCRHQEFVVVGYSGIDGTEVRIKVKKSILTTVGDAESQPVDCLQPVG